MDIVLKGIAGGLLTAAIVWFSKRGNTLPGILPLFPTFALIALLVIGAKNDAAAFRETCIAGVKTIPAYLVFLGICYAAIGRVDFRLALLLGLAGWFVTVLAAFYIRRTV